MAERIVAVVGGLLAIGCSEAIPEPSPPPPPGGIVVRAETAGPPDPDGYLIVVDNGSPLVLQASGSLTVNGLSVGAHDVVLTGVATGCVTQGPGTVVATVRSAAVTTVRFAIQCRPVHPSGDVVSAQAIAGAPYGVATANNGTHYVALIASRDLIRRRNGQDLFTDRVSVGETPPHVALDTAGRMAYATLQTGQGVVGVDAATNQLLATLRLPSDGFNLAVSPDGTRVYATTAAGTLHVLGAPALTPIAMLNVGPAANGLAFSPTAQTLYVTSRDAATVTAVNTLTNSIMRTYPLGGMPQRIAVSPDGRQLYIANELLGLQIVDVATGAVAALPFGGTPYGLGLTPDGEQLYLLLASSGQVVVIDRPTLAVRKTIQVGGVPRNVVFSYDGRVALVTNQQEVVSIR